MWFGLSARRDAAGRAVSFYPHSDLALDDVAAMIPPQGVDVAGAMHTGADVVADALAAVRGHFAGPLMAYPDSGYFEMPEWRFVDTLPPDRYARFCREWIGQGVQVLGGCCGLGVEHVRAAAQVRDEGKR